MIARSPLVIISGCSGYGGLDEAVVAATGGRVVAHIEYDAAPARILAHRYPGVPNYADVTKVDWLSMADEVVPDGAELCLTAGYPCQPFSSAGKRRGVEDERHLWPYFAEGIRQLRPALVVFENVRNHLNLGFDQVLADLAELGYDTTWTLLKASDVGAPHGRAWLFIVGRRRVHAAPSRPPVARLDEDRWVEPAEGLFGAVEWRGKIPVTGRVVDGGMYPLVLPELTEAALHAADPAEDDLLPTPKQAARASRRALTQQHWTAPALEQALELARSELPREYASWDEVRGKSGAARPDEDRLLPTPEAKLSDSGPDYARAEREGSGGDDLTTTVFRAFVTDDPARQLLPSPTAALAGGGQTSRSGDRRDELLLSGIAEAAAEGRLLPTPTGSDGTGGGCRSNLSWENTTKPTGEGGASRLRDVAGLLGPAEIEGSLLPTPEAADGSGGRITAEKGGTRPSGAKRAIYLATAIAHDVAGREFGHGELLPTPTAWEQRGTPDTDDRNLLPLTAQRIASAQEDGPLLPTPTCQDGANTGGPSQFERNSLPLNALATTFTEDDELLPTPRASDGTKGSPNQRGSSGDLMLVPAVLQRTQPAPADAPATGTDWGPYTAAVRRWEAVVGPAPAPTEPNTAGKQRLSPAFPEWMMGLPRGWVTEVPGISRNDQLKAIGNGVVPQQGYVAVARQLALLPW